MNKNHDNLAIKKKYFIDQACLVKIAGFVTCTSPIMHLICPPKILHNLSGCFLFLLDITAVPRPIENSTYGKFFWEKRRIMEDVQVAYIGVVVFFIGPNFVSVNTMLDLLQVDLS